MPVKTATGEYVIFIDKPEGNAMSIICIVCDMLKQIHGDVDYTCEYVEEFREKAMMSGSYENLQKLAHQYVPGLLVFAHSSEYSVRATKV